MSEDLSQQARQAIKSVTGAFPDRMVETVRRSIIDNYGLDDADIIRRIDAGLARRALITPER